MIFRKKKKAIRKWINIAEAEVTKAAETHFRNSLKSSLSLRTALPFVSNPPGNCKPAAKVMVVMIVIAVIGKLDVLLIFRSVSGSSLLLSSIIFDTTGSFFVACT